MAILDSLSQFANSVALPTGGTGTFNIGDVIDTVNVRDVGAGTPLVLEIRVINAVTSGGLATVQFVLVSDSQNPPRTDGNQNQHELSFAVPVATLIQGYALRMKLPYGGGAASPAYGEFLGLQAVIGTAALTAGSVTAGLVQNPPGGDKQYASAVNGL